MHPHIEINESSDPMNGAGAWARKSGPQSNLQHGDTRGNPTVNRASPYANCRPHPTLSEGVNKFALHFVLEKLTGT